MDENYVLAKQIVSERFGENESVYPLFLLCVYGLLWKYKDYKDVVKDIFLNVLILIDRKSINDIMLNNGIDPLEYYGNDFGEVEANEDLNSFTRGVSTSGNNYVLYNGCEFVNEKIKPFIICSTINCSDADLLMTLIHEFGHLIKGRINDTYLTKEDDYFGYIIRSGLSIYEYRYYPSDDTYSEGVSYNIFDEAVNCLQTTDIGGEILKLDGVIPDKGVQDYFDILDRETLKKDFGYEAVCCALNPLWNNDVFRNLIENNIIEGNINRIIEDFDSIVLEDSFDDLDDLLLTIDDLEIQNLEDSVEMKANIEKVLEITERFNERTREMVKAK